MQTTSERQVYPSDHPFGVPDLLPVVVNLPVEIVAYRSRRLAAGDVVHHYVDDYRFEHCWTRPGHHATRLKSIGVSALIQPDFSMWDHLPLAMRIWNLYRSRWIARYWQERGLTVIPSITWCKDTWDTMAVGIPAKSVVAIEARPRFKDVATLKHAIDKVASEISPSCLILYGASREIEQYAKSQIPTRNYPAWTPRTPKSVSL